MLDAYKTLVTNQFEATLCTLATCIDRCPDSSWNAPVAKYAFSTVAFHTLFFTDYYLSANIDAFKQQTFHRENAEFFGDYEELDREPETLYEKPAIQNYLDHCRNKAVKAMATATAESLAGPSGFERRDCSRAELHVYNIRHIQHHAAQLILRLRLDTNVDIPWIAHGWQDV